MNNLYLLIITCVLLFSCSDDTPKDKIYTLDGVAIDGYDPVAYFTEGEAQKGQSGIVSEYDGVQYQFSSDENKALFESEPESYVPAYGGWCAYAVAENANKMDPDPTMWKIQDGKLLMFYNDWTSSITGSLLEAWEESPESYEEKANANWQVMNP